MSGAPRTAAVFLDPSIRLPRYYLLGALTDLSLYILFTALTHRVLLDLGGQAFELALVALAWAVPYVLTTAFAGGVADRFSRGSVARIGAAVYGIASVLLAMSCHIQEGNRDLALVVLYALVALVGGGLGFFWPALQAAIADASTTRTLERNLGAFNIAWSLGKALGFLVGGYLYQQHGAAHALGLAAGIGLVVAAGVPRSPRERADLPSLASDGDMSDADRARWRRLGWLANFGAWGLGATLVMLYPDLNESYGRSPLVFGLVLMLVYLSQTATFDLLRRGRWWVYRIGPFVGAQALGAVLVLVLGFARPLFLVLPAAIGIGVSLGMGYYASITYSLRTDRDRGRNTGRHEAALGSANFLIPLVGGRLVVETGVITSPYVLAASVVGAILLIQAVVFLRNR